MTAPDSEKALWRPLRIRRIAPLAWVFGGFLVLAPFIGNPDAKDFLEIAAIVWFVGFIVLGMLNTHTRCPRCGLRYYKNRREPFARVFFTKACRNCGARPPGSSPSLPGQ